MGKQKSFLEWEKTHVNQISADHHTKEDGSKEELLILQENLDNQVQKNTNIYVRKDNTLCWNYHTEYTDELDPTDTGAGLQIRFWFGVYLDE